MTLDRCVDGLSAAWFMGDGDNGDDAGIAIDLAINSSARGLLE